MKFRSDIFYISLVILYFIDVGTASSDNEGEKSVRGGRHRWALEEEAKLIFFDVSTDIGKPKHFDRIKEKWRREYPNSNVTDNALRHKLHKLREESTEEGELKRNFKWNPESNEELIDVYHTTYPHMKDADISLEKEWKRRHPDYQATGNYLLSRVQMLFKKYRYLRYRKPGSSILLLHVDNEERLGEKKHQWTEDEKVTLLRIHHLTDTGEPKQFCRIKSEWRQKFPDSKLSDKALRNMLHRLRQASRKKGERQKFFTWSPEEDRMLLDTYLNTYPYRNDVNITFKDAWKQQQRGSTVTDHYLQFRARKLLKGNKYPEYSARDRAARNLN